MLLRIRDADLRRWVRRQLRELGVRPPLAVGEICQALAVRRGREIRLKAHPFDVPGPFGMWLATGEVDYVLYQSETSVPHQNHIILHELGHIMAGHTSSGLETLELFLPNLSPRTIERGLRRESYSPRQEKEAELVATIVLGWTSVLDHIAPPSTSDRAETIVVDALGDRSGWL